MKTPANPDARSRIQYPSYEDTNYDCLVYLNFQTASIRLRALLAQGNWNFPEYSYPYMVSRYFFIDIEKYSI
jgi:hypothetical protein